MPSAPDTPANPIRYNDWEITLRHAEIVEAALPSGLRKPKVHRQIPGVINKNITTQFETGVYLMPLGVRTEITNNATHDMTRRSLLVAGVGLTSSSSRTVPPLVMLMETLRIKFAHRRVAMLNGELYSFIEDESDYSIDDALARKMDVQIAILASVFREDR